MNELGRIWVDNLAYFLPELCLTVTILLLPLVDVLFHRSRGGLVRTLAVAGLLAAFITAWMDLGRLLETGGSDSLEFFAGLLASDPMGGYFRLLVISVTLLACLAAFTSRELKDVPQGEFLMLLLSVTLGMCLLSNSLNLLMLYLSLELVSIPSYGLVAYLKRSRTGAEASLKYILVGALSTGSMLYGITLLYGLTGTYDLAEIGNFLTYNVMTGPNRYALLLAGLLTLAGFGFKIAAVPFHFWAPDVYTGAPTPVTAFLTIGPKAAGFAALLRFLSMGIMGPENLIGIASTVDWRAVLIAISVLTMTLGNLSAFFQDDLKRLLGYSSIAHAGFMLMGAVAMSEAGIKGVLAYMAIYLFMNLGAFVVVIYLYNQTGSPHIRGLRGIAKASPAVAGLMAVLTLSLMGIPPFAGFWAKWYLFLAVIEQAGTDPRLLWFAGAGALNTVFGYFYYARILKAMYLEEPRSMDEKQPAPAPVRLRLSPLQWVLLLVLTVPNALFVWPFWGPLDRFAGAASHMLGVLF